MDRTKTFWVYQRKAQSRQTEKAECSLGSRRPQPSCQYLQFAAHRGSAVLHEVQHSDCPHAQAQQHTKVVHQQHGVLPWGLPTVRRLQGVLYKGIQRLQAPCTRLPRNAGKSFCQSHPTNVVGMFYFILRQCLMNSRLALNSVCSPG